MICVVGKLICSKRQTAMQIVSCKESCFRQKEKDSCMCGQANRFDYLWIFKECISSRLNLRMYNNVLHALELRKANGASIIPDWTTSSLT